MTVARSLLRATVRIHGLLRAVERMPMDSQGGGGDAASPRGAPDSSRGGNVPEVRRYIAENQTYIILARGNPGD